MTSETGGPGRHGYDEHDGPTTNREGIHRPPTPNPKRIDEVTERSLAFIEKQVAAGQPFPDRLSGRPRTLSGTTRTTAT